MLNQCQLCLGMKNVQNNVMVNVMSVFVCFICVQNCNGNVLGVGGCSLFQQIMLIVVSNVYVSQMVSVMCLGCLICVLNSQKFQNDSSGYMILLSYVCWLMFGNIDQWVVVKFYVVQLMIGMNNGYWNIVGWLCLYVVLISVILISIML